MKHSINISKSYLLIMVMVKENYSKLFHRNESNFASLPLWNMWKILSCCINYKKQSRCSSDFRVYLSVAKKWWLWTSDYFFLVSVSWILMKGEKRCWQVLSPHIHFLSPLYSFMQHRFSEQSIWIIDTKHLHDFFEMNTHGVKSKR